MIRTENLVKSFGDMQALDHLTCEIGSESVYGLIGSNGAGKSTLLRLIAGIYKPDSGSLTYEDQPIYGQPDLRQEIILVPDMPVFLPGESLAGMKEFYRKIYRGFSLKRYQEMLEIFPLDEQLDLGKMSKGMRRQASLLLALACSPRLLLMDEAFDGLDPVMRDNLKRILAREVISDGLTCIIASHNLRELEGFCDHVGLIHRGSLVYEHELTSLDLGVYKVQAAFRTLPEAAAFEKLDLDLLHYERQGSVLNLVIRGDQDEIREKLAEHDPLILDFLPLNLEELFIYVLEGRGYEVHQLLA